MINKQKKLKLEVNKAILSTIRETKVETQKVTTA